MTADDFRAAGLYDPGSPNAAGRLELLQWLAERGVTIEEMIDRGNRSLSGLAGDLALRPGRRLTAREIAAREGMSVEDVLSLALAAGLSSHASDHPAFIEDDFA